MKQNPAKAHNKAKPPKGGLSIGLVVGAFFILPTIAGSTKLKNNFFGNHSKAGETSIAKLSDHFAGG
jgi:hypothetical protein